MNTRLIVLTAILATALNACATASAPSRTIIGKAALLSDAGARRGVATLSRVGDTLELQIEGTNFPNGVHGAHLHAVGSCVAPQFASAGPHLNPLHKMHGEMNPAGAHLGDLPNLTITADGSGNLLAVPRGSPAEIDAAIFDADGTAIVIHADADDYRTDPSGNSGTRIACGVFTRAG